MNMRKSCAAFLMALGWCWFGLLLLSGSTLVAGTAPAGLFQDHVDVGSVQHPGAVAYDAAKGSYTVSGSGSNLWSTADAFHFVWKKVSGDLSLAADSSFLGAGANGHGNELRNGDRNEDRKAVLMVRQSLDADSVYASVALHGSGLTTLQYRDEKGAETHEIRAKEAQANADSAERLRIEKRGNFVYLFLGDNSGSTHTKKDMRFSGASMRVRLQGTYYVGIGVCSGTRDDDKDEVEKAVFSNVDLAENLAPAEKTTLYSTLERVSVASVVRSMDRRVVYVAPEHFEAPN